MKKILVLLAVMFIGNSAFAETWVNDMRSLFQNNRAVILTVNMRTFAAKDIDGNGIIEKNKGEVRGNFSNAISRLDEVQKLGVNTIHLLPITEVGMRKAYGTAGSLFAPSSFTKINPQLNDEASVLNIKLQAKNFVDECHKRNLRVIVEMPAFASYDMYLKKPQYFLKNKDRTTIVASDWNDVRILKAGSEYNVNQDIYQLYKAYMDLVLSLNVDGVVVNEPSTKPAAFWAKLITYSRGQNHEFLFLAEMKPSVKKSIVKQLPFVSLNKLLNVGFDGYFGDFNNIADWKTSDELFNQIGVNDKINAKYAEKKAVVGSFSTYNDISPVVTKGAYLSKMIIWLNSTLPVNAIYTDGFQTGDDYDFAWANLRANYSETDDNIYFVNRGKLDLYNFSRRPGGVKKDIKDDFYLGNQFKSYMKEYLPNARFIPIKIKDKSVFVFAMSDAITKNTAVVIGNLDNENIKEITVKIPRLSYKTQTEIVKSVSVPQIRRGKISTVIAPGDIQVIVLKNLAIK